MSFNNIGLFVQYFMATYIGCGSFFVLCNAALQVKGQIMTADQHPLPKLLLELPCVRLDAREIQFLLMKEMLLNAVNCYCTLEIYSESYREGPWPLTQVSLLLLPVCQGPK